MKLNCVTIVKWLQLKFQVWANVNSLCSCPILELFSARFKNGRAISTTQEIVLGLDGTIFTCHSFSIRTFVVRAFGDLQTAAEATIGHGHWRPSTTIGTDRHHIFQWLGGHWSLLLTLVPDGRSPNVFFTVGQGCVTTSFLLDGYTIFILKSKNLVGLKSTFRLLSK